jgi:hypothetical protein
MAVIWWVWALPVLLRPGVRRLIDGNRVLFLAVWLLPGWIIESVFHVAAPGHTMASIPALCLAGAWVLSVAARELFASEEGFLQFREALFGAALVLNVMLFLNFFPTPPPAGPGARPPSLINAIAYATNETTLGTIRSMDNVAWATLNEIRRFTPQNRPSLIISSDVHAERWILNWRILRYYEPSRDIWALADTAVPKTALQIRRYQSLQSASGDPVRVNVPRGGRILWILEKSGAFYKNLCPARCTGEGQYVAYTDLPVKDPTPFTIQGFEFVPTRIKD